MPLFLIDVGGGVLCLGEFFVQRNYHCFNWFWEWGTMMGGGCSKKLPLFFIGFGGGLLYAWVFLSPRFFPGESDKF